MIAVKFVVPVKHRLAVILQGVIRGNHAGVVTGERPEGPGRADICVGGRKGHAGPVTLHAFFGGEVGNYLVYGVRFNFFLHAISGAMYFMRHRDGSSLRHILSQNSI